MSTGTFVSDGTYIESDEEEVMITENEILKWVRTSALKIGNDSVERAG